MQAQGLVEVVSAKTETNAGKRLRSPLYSVKLDTGDWFGCGFDNPNVTKGDNITFNFKEGQYGKEMDVNTVVKAAAGAGSSGSSAGSPAPTISGDQRQASIVYQSSRKDAIALLTVAAERELVKLPKNGGFDALLGMVDDLTREYALKAINPDLSEQSSVEVEVVADE